MTGFNVYSTSKAGTLQLLHLQRKGSYEAEHDGLWLCSGVQMCSVARGDVGGCVGCEGSMEGMTWEQHDSQ